MKSPATYSVILPCVKEDAILRAVVFTRGLSESKPLRLLLAKRETAETPHNDVFTRFSDHLTHQVTDGHGLILHIRLHHQHLLAKDLLEFTVDEVFAPGLGDASNRLVLQDLPALCFNHIGRYVFEVDVLRCNSGDLQSQLAGQFAEALAARNKVCATVELQQHTHVMIVVDIRENAPLLGLTTRSDHLLGLAVASGLKNLDGLAPILRFGQGVFTIGKCCIGLLTQLLNVCGSILHGLVSPQYSLV